MQPESLQFQAGEKSIGFFILGDGLVDDILRKLVIAVGIGFEPVADKLLVVLQARSGCCRG